MKRVLVATMVWWATALSLTGHPALTGAAEASGCTCSAPEDSPATPTRCRRAIRSARDERRPAGDGAVPVAVPCMRDAPARVDDQPEPPGGTPLALASLVSSVTRAPRAPPRS